MKYTPHHPRPHLTELFSHGTRRSYKKGEIIQSANETPKGVYFVISGHIKEYTLSRDGTEHLTIVYEPGDIFSFNWIYLQIDPNVYREAHTNAEVFCVSQDIFSAAVNENQQVHAEFTQFLMELVHNLSSRVENLTFNNAYDKVAYHLIHLAGRFGKPHKDGWFVTLPFRHQQIADSLSMTRETASRMIEKIERQGHIKQDGRGHFIIRNPSALASTIGIEEVMGMWPKLTRQNNT